MKYAGTTEEQVQLQLAEYMRLAYPTVIFRSDLGGVRLTPAAAGRAARLQSGRGWPDFFIAKPVPGYAGLFIEIKRPGTKIYTRKGVLVSDKHIREQHEMIQSLLALGYQARFGVGFNPAKMIVDEYLSGAQL